MKNHATKAAIKATPTILATDIPIFTPVERLPDSDAVLLLVLVKPPGTLGGGVRFGRATTESLAAVVVGAKTWVTTMVVGSARSVLLRTSSKRFPQSSVFVS